MLGGPFQPFADVVLARAPGTGFDPGQTFDLTGETARLVRLEITSNHGDATQVGLAEIEISADDEPGPATVTGGVHVLGGYSAQAGEQRDRDPQTFPTVLSGDLAQNDSLGRLTDNVATVITLDGDGAILDGFTVERGFGGSGGGGILTRGQVELRNLLVRNNSAVRGAGIFVAAGSPTIESCTMERNRATINGGAIWGGGSVHRGRHVYLERRPDPRQRIGEGRWRHLSARLLPDRGFDIHQQQD